MAVEFSYERADTTCYGCVATVIVQYLVPGNPPPLIFVFLKTQSEKNDARHPAVEGVHGAPTCDFEKLYTQYPISHPTDNIHRWLLGKSSRNDRMLGTARVAGVENLRIFLA